MMSMFSAIDSAAAGLTAERFRMDVISNNIANVNTTRTVDGGPYRRQYVTFEPRSDSGQMPFSQVLSNVSDIGEGVRVSGVGKDNSAFRRVYDPSHPDADSLGYVSFPNVNIVTEMVDMITATRAYEANVASVNAAKSMALKALDIGK